MADAALRGRLRRGPEPWLVTSSTVALVGEGGPVQARGRMWTYWVLGATPEQRQALQYIHQVRALLRSRGPYGEYPECSTSVLSLAAQVLQDAISNGEISIQIEEQQ